MRNALLFATLALTACGEVALPASDVRLEQLEVSAPGDSFPQRTSLQLHAFGIFSDGRKVDLTREVTWSSSNADTVLVTNDGVAVLRGSGTALVNAGWGLSTGSLALTSTPAKVQRLSLPVASNAAVPKGHTLQLRATAWYDDGSSHDVTAQAQWGSVNHRATATDAPGQFVAASEGEASVRVFFEGFSAEQAFTVSGPLFEGVVIQARAQLVHLGDLQRLQAFARYSDGSGAELTADCDWSSTDLAVVSVANEGESRGTLAAHGVGHASVQAICGSRSVTTDFEVAARRAVSLTGSDALKLPRGLDGQARVHARYDDGALAEATDFVTFSSSDVSVATVSNSPGFRGQVHAVGEGRAVITAHLGEVSSSVDVVVLPATLQQLTATLADARIVMNQVATFVLFGRFSDGSVVNLTPSATFVSGAEAAVLVGASDATFIGQSLGLVNVQASVAGHVTQFAVEVTNATVTGLALHRVAGITRPGSERLEAIATWSDGRQTNVSELAQWTSSDPTIALVRNAPGARGYVQTMGGGDFTVTCDLGADQATFALSFPTTP